MFQFALLLNLISNISTNIDFISDFLTNLEISQNLHSTYVLKQDNSKYSDEIIKSLTLPTITIQYGMPINYLNFTKFETINYSLKFYFNKQFMTILIAQVFNESIFQNHILFEILNFSRENILVIITDQIYNNWINVLRRFRSLKFSNVIYFDIEDFRKYQKFGGFDSISEYSPVVQRKFVKETISNLKKYKLKVACFNQFPLCRCFRQNNRTKGIGPIFKVFENFIQFINGTMELIVYDNETLNIWDFDLLTKIEINTLILNRRIFPLDFETFSNSLEKFDIVLIIPKADFINQNLYIIKPFSTSIIFLILGYLIYGPIIFNLTFFIINRKTKFWKIFSQLLRSLLAQSFSKPLEGPQISLIYLLGILLGYILTIWYSALLGSYFTTFIRESQISTLGDLKKSNISIAISNVNNYYTAYGYRKISDLIALLPVNEETAALKAVNRSYGFIIWTYEWESSNFPNFYFKIKNFSLETTFIRIAFHLNSIYKTQFNQYLNIIQDCGLYNYWKEHSYYDWLKVENEEDISTIKRNINIIENSRRILIFKYFTYPFLFLTCGCLFGIIAFAIEIVVGNYRFCKTN